MALALRPEWLSLVIVGYHAVWWCFQPDPPIGKENVNSSGAKTESEGRVRRTVLLVDDEPTVRKVLQRVLERSGFAVLIASNADDALAIAARHEGTIDLLVSDVVMPATQGPELARMLCEQYPALRVLFVSGYPGSRIQDESIPPSAEFLNKPFSPSDLADKVASVLSDE